MFLPLSLSVKPQSSTNLTGGYVLCSTASQQRAVKQGENTFMSLFFPLNPAVAILTLYDQPKGISSIVQTHLLPPNFENTLQTHNLSNFDPSTPWRTIRVAFFPLWQKYTTVIKINIKVIWVMCYFITWWRHRVFSGSVGKYLVSVGDGRTFPTHAAVNSFARVSLWTNDQMNTDLRSTWSHYTWHALALYTTLSQYWYRNNPRPAPRCVKPLGCAQLGGLNEVKEPVRGCVPGCPLVELCKD